MADLYQTNRTWLCSVVFLDIVNYSSKSVELQIKWKQRFNSYLGEAIQNVPENERVIIDTGDGAAVCFLGAPEAAMFAALEVWHFMLIDENEQENRLKLRIGINLGPIKLVRGINGAPNVLGDAMNAGQRIMSFAMENQILVSQSYYEVVSRLSDDYKTLFTLQGVERDKHIREHTVYNLSPAVGDHSGVVAALEQSGTAGAPELRFAAPAAAPPQAVPAAVAGQPSAPTTPRPPKTAPQVAAAPAPPAARTEGKPGSGNRSLLLGAAVVVVVAIAAAGAWEYFGTRTKPSPAAQVLPNPPTSPSAKPSALSAGAPPENQSTPSAAGPDHPQESAEATQPAVATAAAPAPPAKARRPLSAIPKEEKQPAAVPPASIPAPEPAPLPPAPVQVPSRIAVDPNVQMTKLVRKVLPTYPSIAKSARVSGVVRLMAVINKDGTIQHLEVVSGNSLLVHAAVEAVQQWVYRPTLIEGTPVEVSTPINVDFTLEH